MTVDDEFVRETKEDLTRLTNGLVTLEHRGTDREQVNDLFRIAHTLKGNCSMAGFDTASRLAHAVEDFLSELRDGTVQLEPELMDAALAAIDDIGVALEEGPLEDASLDPDPTITALRKQMERSHMPSSHDTTTVEEPTADTPHTEPEFDSAVEEALDSASKFDDLESLIDEMDDSEVDDVSAWGTFTSDSSSEQTTERSGEDGERSGSVTPSPDSATSPTSDPHSAETMDDFDAIKQNVETDPISNLDRELEDVEFGEFDDDDDLSIQQLVEGDLSASKPSHEAGSPVSYSPETDPESGSTMQTPSELSKERSDADPTVHREDPTAPDSTTPPAVDDEYSDEFVGLAADADSSTEDLSSDTAGDPFETGAFDASDPDSESDDGLTSEAHIDDNSVEADLPPEEVDLPDETDLQTDAEGISETVDLSGEKLASDAAVDTTEPELDGINLPDLDDFSNVVSESSGAPSDSDISFVRDEHTVEFESRFAERFSEDNDHTDAPSLVQIAAPTLTESNLNTAWFRSTKHSDEFGDFGGSDRRSELQSISVDVENADTLLNLVEELSLTQLRLKQKSTDGLSEQERMDDETHSNDGAEQRTAPRHRLTSTIDEDISELESVTADLRRTVMQIRLMPLSTAVEGLPRLVRDLARTQDKQVSFEIHDEDVHLDRGIVARLGDPLGHIVRNAVDHGIEPPAERARKNKPAEGTIELRAWRDRERVFIELEDDGRGISAEHIRTRAVENGIIDEHDAETMPLDEVYDLVFEPGFTTTDEVTDVSGRGVGMDAVRRTVNSLDGTATIRSEPDAGTTVRLSLPVSVAVSDMLFIGVGSERYAIPASTVATVEPFDESSLVGDDRVTVPRPAGSETTDDAPDQLPLVRLTEAFDVPDGGSEEQVLVHLSSDTRELALLCDTVGDAREVVVKPYEKLLGDIPGVSGATLTGDGTLVNIIDMATL